LKKNDRYFFSQFFRDLFIFLYIEIREIVFSRFSYFSSRLPKSSFVYIAQINSTSSNATFPSSSKKSVLSSSIEVLSNRKSFFRVHRCLHRILNFFLNRFLNVQHFVDELKRLFDLFHLFLQRILSFNDGVEYLDHSAVCFMSWVDQIKSIGVELSKLCCCLCIKLCSLTGYASLPRFLHRCSDFCIIGLVTVFLIFKYVQQFLFP
jgi:hypothetical protein